MTLQAIFNLFIISLISIYLFHPFIHFKTFSLFASWLDPFYSSGSHSHFNTCTERSNALPTVPIIEVGPEAIMPGHGPFQEEEGKSLAALASFWLTHSCLDFPEGCSFSRKKVEAP